MIQKGSWLPYPLPAIAALVLSGMRTICRFSVLCALACAAVILPVSCASGGGREARTGGAGGQDLTPGRAAAGPEYSPNTLLISLEDGLCEEDVQALAARYDMEILYLYQNLNMCAVKLPRDYSDAEFRTLIKRLEAEPAVISAERDAIVRLHDSK